MPKACELRVRRHGAELLMPQEVEFRRQAKLFASSQAQPQECNKKAGSAEDGAADRDGELLFTPPIGRNSAPTYALSTA